MTACQTDPVLTHLRRFALNQRGRVTDGELLERFLARRDDAAFEELVRRHGPMVLGVCRRALGEAHDADDAFQATFLILARRAASVVPASRVGPWLYGVARRTALKARSSAARRRCAERDAALGRTEWSSDAPTGDDLRPLLDEELGRLPEKYRAPLVLCLLQEKSRKEAAGLLGWTEGTLSGRLARAKEMLGGRLQRRGVSLAGAALLAEVSPSLAASAASNAVSTAAVALTEEVLKPMLLSKMKVVVGALVLAAGIGLGAGAAAYRPAPAALPKAEAKLAAAPEEKAKRPPYVIEPPDILRVRWRNTDGTMEVSGDKLLVRPDGTISLGTIGTVHVAGRTVEQAREAVAKHMSPFGGSDQGSLTVDVVAFNSKFFYVITEAADGNEQVVRVPATGNETVLDALANLSPVGQRRVSIRRTPGDGRSNQTLRVDWEAITQRGNASTNYQLLPGDRVYVKGEKADDLVGDLEAAVKALREARSHEEQRRAFDALDAVTKKLRGRLK